MIANFLHIPLLVSQESRKEYFTLVTMQLLTITTGVFLAVVTLGYLYGFYDASPFPFFISLQLLAGVGWWLTKIGRWRWVTLWPSLYFFAISVSGTMLNGMFTSMVLFYVIAFLLVGVMIDVRSMFIVMASGLVIHLTVAQTLHPQVTEELIPAIIVFSAAFLGIALLQWLSQSVMNQALEQCFRDPLTGVYNRSYFEGMLIHFQRRQRYAFPVSVLMADIDGLKGVNDTFGHAAGDTLIAHAAHSLTNACRSKGIVCRIGGDEFLALLPRTDAATATRIAQHLSSLLASDAPLTSGVRLRLSTGVATATSPQVLQTTLAEADVNLYVNKRSRPG